MFEDDWRAVRIREGDSLQFILQFRRYKTWINKGYYNTLEELTEDVTRKLRKP